MYYFIDPMREEDIEDVRTVEHASFTTHWSLQTYHHELRLPATNRYIVARSSPTPPPPRGNNHSSTPPNLANLLQGLLGRFFGAPPVAAASNSHSYPYPIVGYGGLWASFDEGHITTIAVHPLSRGCGIGELLLNGLIDLAFEMNMETLTLEVRRSNTVAQNLYLKYGFLLMGERPRYYSDNGEDALIMTTGPIHHPDYQARLHELRWNLFTRLQAQAELYQQQRQAATNGSAPLPHSPTSLSSD